MKKTLIIMTLILFIFSAICFAAVPVHNADPDLDSSGGSPHLTGDDLTCTAYTSDADGDDIKNIINWKESGSSITVLNMPFESLTEEHTAVTDQVAYWQFEGNALDSTTNNNDGTVIGATLTTGKVGQAYSFDGIADYINVGNDVSLQISGSLTISSWIKVSDLGSNEYLISKYGYNIYLTSSEIPRFETRNAANTGWDTDAVGSALTIGEWAHIVAVYNTDSDEKIVYVNGVAGTPVSKTDDGFGGYASANVNIGRYGTGSSQYIDASIDEVQLYDRALSASEVLALYEEGADSTEATPDYSGNSNTGTVTSATWSATGGHDGFGAYSFDGTDDEISIPSSTSMNLGGSTSMTIEGWAKIDAVSGSKEDWIVRHLDGIYAMSTYQTRLYCYIEDETCAYRGGYKSLNTGDDAFFHHYACTFDFDNDIITYYQDGVSLGTTGLATGSSICSTGTSNINIGNGGGVYFNGFIDDLRIYDRALSSSQIAELASQDTITLSSAETDYADQWVCSVTPADDNQEVGSTVDSNSITIAGSSGDHDGDGVADGSDIDLDGDGILNTVEGGAGTDTDGDGIDDQYDGDSDNDGVADAIEGHDANNDGVADAVPSGTDTDGDGLDNAFDTDNGGTAAPVQDTDSDTIKDFQDDDDDDDTVKTNVETPIGNTDGDGFPNYLDSDDDGDTILTSSENPPNQDTDNDGIKDFLDNDDDGDTILTANEGPPNQDTDSDGVKDYKDPDDDNDGILTSVEGTSDPDGDGIPNYKDLDSDNNGAVNTGQRDIIEAHDANLDGIADWDTDQDYVLDVAEGNVDTDGDGILDAFDLDNGGTIAPNPDTDTDGIKNFADLDNDGDNAADLSEIDASADFPGFVDDDILMEYNDPDSDGDGVLDKIEYWDDNWDGVADTVTTGDANNNGLDDAYEAIQSSNPADMPNRDDDSDITSLGIASDINPDVLDIDDDNDGILTSVEGTANTDVAETATDSHPDYLDTDSDGDGVIDLIEGNDKDNSALATTTPPGDGFADSIAVGIDTDQDGLDDTYDTDDGGTAVPVQDTDSDGTKDFKDPDDDQDGVITRQEDANNDQIWYNDDDNLNNIPNYLDAADINEYAFSCFLAGTKVTMADRTLKNIEDIEVGDEVLSFNEATGENQASKVTEILMHKVNKEYLVIDGLKVTPEHLMFVNNKWKDAASVAVGDLLLNTDGKSVVVSTVEKVAMNGLTIVYNLEVENTHTYYAENVLVHNDKLGGEPAVPEFSTIGILLALLAVTIALGLFVFKKRK